jgi:predicted kinase
MSNATVYMLCGMPSSGKSSWAIENASVLNAEILSSDSLRETLFGDVSRQDKNTEIFQYMYNQAKVLLNSGKNVIIDATNISRKKRVHFNNEFFKYNRNIIYFNTSHSACIMRDLHRNRTVGKDIILKMFKNLQIPTYSEGWDNIEIKYDKYMTPFTTKDNFEKWLLNDWSYEEMFNFPRGLCQFSDFSNIFELPQDNPHHTFSVSRHIYHVYKYVYDNYNKDKITHAKDFLKMLWVAVFHDVGKGHTKTFTNINGEPKRTASYYGHENVSGQIACSILNVLGYDDDFILEVVELVQLHMRLTQAETEKSVNKLKNSVSQDTFENLEFLFLADTSAK